MAVEMAVEADALGCEPEATAMAAVVAVEPGEVAMVMVAAEVTPPPPEHVALAEVPTLAVVGAYGLEAPVGHICRSWCHTNRS